MSKNNFKSFNAKICSIIILIILGILTVYALLVPQKSNASVFTLTVFVVSYKGHVESVSRLMNQPDCELIFKAMKGRGATENSYECIPVN
jgi:hypothetical protein